MIFIPVENTREEDLAIAQESLATLDASQMTKDGHEVTSPTVKEFNDYKPILEALSATLQSGDRAYLCVEWVKKKNCIILVTDSIEDKVKDLAGKGFAVKYERIEEKLWEETNRFITDRSEFEGLADILAECVKGKDRFYLGFDWKEKRNAILWSTDNPGERGLCANDKGVATAAKN